MAQLYVTFLIAAASISALGFQHRHDKFLNKRHSGLVERHVSSFSSSVDGLHEIRHDFLSPPANVLPTPPAHIHHALPISASLESQTSKSQDASLWQRLTVKESIGLAIFLVCCLMFFGAFAALLVRLLVTFNDIKGTEVGKSWAFRDFVAYRFAYWITWSNWSYSTLIFIMAVLFMLIGTTLYHMLVHVSIFSSAYKVFLSLMDPGGGRDERSTAGAFVCGLMSVGGLAFFALVLTFVQERFEQYMRHQTMGLNPVMEKDHVVIIGLAAEGLMLLQELAYAYEKEGGVAIAILSEKLTKPEMEERIRNAGLHMGRSRIIVRYGIPQYIRGLESVAVASAKRVILIADQSQEKELRDAFLIQCLIAISSKGWPETGRILVECSLVRNKPLFKRLGGDRLDVVMTDAFMSEMFIQISFHEGLGRAISNSFSFTGSVFQVVSVPEQLVGKRMIEAAMHYPSAVPVGVLKHGGHCHFGGEFQLQLGDDMILLGECAISKHLPTSKPFYEVELPSAGSVQRRREELLKNMQETPRDPETIFIFGWGAFVGILIVHLDYVVPTGTQIVCISHVEEEKRQQFLERSQQRWQHKLQNITTFEHVVGPIASPLLIDDLKTPLDQASRIFVLSEPNLDIRESDALVIAAVQQIRNILSEKAIARSIPIIPEIRDSRSDQLCTASLALDFLDSSGLPNRFLACAAYDYRLQYALESMLSARGDVKFDICSIEAFLPQNAQVPEQLSFVQVQDMVSRSGGVALGWSVGAQKHEPAGHNLHRTMTEIFARAHGALPFHWEINPPNKTNVREWTELDSVIVFEPLSITGKSHRVSFYDSPRSP
mmetsp:Transcript_155192/g.268908  ORF Transcript_155192/g.268908 Transcript_155192/m.268908 type:complete len:830 (-) Transcript_155192:20-2509(-)